MADKDIIDGQVKQVQGRAEHIVGAVTGDSETETKGKAHEVAGKIQEGFGRVKDAVRETVDDDDDKL